ncbi:hypothetical protein [Bosea sp. F3-2]|uniref:hypothetical protein n=1 Tax=Bosea sp. F3-2 TaxID=2599640 RepID=UPI00165595C6|nr:hypothetical protein [Bosea sp. F3-2]
MAVLALVRLVPVPDLVRELLKLGCLRRTFGRVAQRGGALYGSLVFLVVFERHRWESV